MPRLTSGASVDGGLCASSKAIALSTCGSPNTFAKTNASRPAARPASMPRIRSPRTVFEPSMPLVAGEAEEMASVVDPLVQGHALHDRRRALLGADEVEQQRRDQREE